MSEEREKTLSYHRAEYFCEQKATINLGLCIKQATDKCTTVADRSILRPGGYYMRLAHLKPDAHSNGHFLHLTFETPGEHASVVPRVATDATELQVSTIPPPNDSEFMDGDAFLYVNRNDICLCTTGVTVGVVRYFLHAFFNAAKIRHDAGEFGFFNATDVRKLALLQSHGVREIEVRASLYRASVDYHKRQHQTIGVLDTTSRFFKAIFGSEHDVTDDSLRVMVTLNVDGRRKKGIKIGHKRMEQLATDIVNNTADDDDYVIVTDRGEKIKPNELVLRRVVKLNSMGKSVARDEAWHALWAYYQDLTNDGQLGQ